MGLCVSRLAVLCLAFATVMCRASPTEETLAIRVQSDSYELSVPVSRLLLTIPRGDLLAIDEPRIGAGASPRYFHFADQRRGIVISGWFESAHAYKGFDTFWKNETEAWATNHLPAPRNVSIVKVGHWDSALYDLDIPGGSNAHVRAEWVQLGTWIDLHISVTTAEPIDKARATALVLLRSLGVTEAP